MEYQTERPAVNDELFRLARQHVVEHHPAMQRSDVGPGEPGFPRLLEGGGPVAFVPRDYP
jgi:hypothetical protein